MFLCFYVIDIAHGATARGVPGAQLGIACDTDTDSWNGRITKPPKTSITQNLQSTGLPKPHFLAALPLFAKALNTRKMVVKLPKVRFGQTCGNFCITAVLWGRVTGFRAPPSLANSFVIGTAVINTHSESLTLPVPNPLTLCLERAQNQKKWQPLNWQTRGRETCAKPKGRRNEALSEGAVPFVWKKRELKRGTPNFILVCEQSLKILRFS